mgnify:CR=1 FL=1
MCLQLPTIAHLQLLLLRCAFLNAFFLSICRRPWLMDIFCCPSIVCLGLHTHTHTHINQIRASLDHFIRASPTTEHDSRATPVPHTHTHTNTLIDVDIFSLQTAAAAVQKLGIGQCNWNMATQHRRHSCSLFLYLYFFLIYEQLHAVADKIIRSISAWAAVLRSPMWRLMMPPAERQSYCSSSLFFFPSSLMH